MNDRDNSLEDWYLEVDSLSRTFVIRRVDGVPAIAIPTINRLINDLKAIRPSRRKWIAARDHLRDAMVAGLKVIAEESMATPLPPR